MQHCWTYNWASCASVCCCVSQTFRPNWVASYSHRAYIHLLAHVFFHVCQSFNGQFSGRSVKERKNFKRGEGRNKERSNPACTVTKHIIFQLLLSWWYDPVKMLWYLKKCSHEVFLLDLPLPRTLLSTRVHRNDVLFKTKSCFKPEENTW